MFALWSEDVNALQIRLQAAVCSHLSSEMQRLGQALREDVRDELQRHMQSVPSVEAVAEAVPPEPSVIQLPPLHVPELQSSLPQSLVPGVPQPPPFQSLQRPSGTAGSSCKTRVSSRPSSQPMCKENSLKTPEQQGLCLKYVSPRVSPMISPRQSKMDETRSSSMRRIVCDGGSEVLKDTARGSDAGLEDRRCPGSGRHEQSSPRSRLHDRRGAILRTTAETLDGGEAELWDPRVAIRAEAVRTRLSMRQPSLMSAIRPTPSLNSMVMHMDLQNVEYANPEPVESMRRFSLLKEKVGLAWIDKVVMSDAFDYTLCGLLLVNALLIGAQVDHQARNFTNEIPWGWRTVDVIFCIIFAVELALRMWVYGAAFFFSDAWRWNVFDLVMVVMQLIEEITTVLSGRYHAASDGTSSTLRLFRVLRLLRVIRVLRFFRFVVELRKVLYLVIASFSSFIWTALLLLMLTYVIGIFFTQVVLDSSISAPEDVPKSSILVAKYFSNTGTSMLSLYQAITGGVDWGDLQHPLDRQISPLMSVVFAAYVAFAVLVLLNLVTGVFVDGAMRLSKEDKQLELIKKVRRAFGQVDSNSTGDITWREFTEKFLCQEMEEVFKAIEINMARAEDLFKFLDQDGSGSLSVEEFAIGAINLQGPAKALDLAMFSIQQRTLLANISDAVTRIEEAWVGERPQSEDGERALGPRYTSMLYKDVGPSASSK